MIAPGRWSVYYAPDRRVVVIDVADPKAGVTREEANEIRKAIGVALDYAATYEPVPNTERAPVPPEPVTKPDTPIPIKRASGEHRLDLPHGIRAEVDAILAEGKEPQSK